MSEGKELSGEAPTAETQAREFGWKPKEEYRGKPENWVPAEEYIKRGETILPYMQADRRRLSKKVEDQGAELAALRGDLSASREAIDTLKQFSAGDALKRKDAEIVDLRRALAEARRGGDVEVEVATEAKLDAAKEEREGLAAEAKPAARGNGNGNATTVDAIRARTQSLMQTPDWKEFIANNPWYESDPVARAAATAISGEIMQDPANRDLSLGDKLAIVAEQTKARMNIGEGPRRRPSKVEGSRGGGGGGGGSGSNEPSYTALSAEAKAACDRQAKSVVGPNRAFKTEADWQKHYARMVS